MALPGRIARFRLRWPGNGRLRRKLAGIERGLATEVRLASMFAMFNALTRGERPSGPESLSRSARAAWALPAPGLSARSARWLTRAAALLAMAALIAGGLLVTAGIHAPDRTCLMLTAGGRPVTLPVAAPVAVGTTDQTAAASSGHDSSCPAYPKK
jgi:hypothetical protein